MAEYKSFHYLMHAAPTGSAPVHYAEAPKPLSFDQLYSPRDQRQIHKSEKSYWRTRDRIEFTIYENRAKNIVFVTCVNLEGGEVYRTIFISMEQLYFEVDCKARGNRDLLTKKSDRAFVDSNMDKAISDFILARLNIKKDPVVWPSFNSEVSTTGQLATDAAPQDTHKERMCTFDKLSSDIYDTLEIDCPADHSFLEGILHIKVSHTLEDTQPPPSVQEVTNTTDEAAVSAVSMSSTNIKSEVAVAATGTVKETTPLPSSLKVNAIAPTPALAVARNKTKATATTASGSCAVTAAPTSARKKATLVGSKNKKIAPES